MATYNKTGTAGNDAWSFANVGGQPSNNNIYNLNGAAGTDSFRFDDGLTSTKYIGKFLSTNFTIGAAVGGVITVTGASTGSTNLTFNLTSVETLIFDDKTVTLTYSQPNLYPPVFTSGGTGTVAENAATSTVIYTAIATDADGTTPTYSLSGTDASLLNINSTSGQVTLKSSADYETKTSYSFNVIASDGTKTATKAVVVSVTNLNDNAPVFTSGATGTVAENAATSTVIYTATATDADNLGALVYSLSGTDASLLNIDAATGAVTLKTSANYETKTSYSFNVVASDGTNTATKAVVVSVTNLNDNAPVFTSGATGTVAENAATSTVIYTATATDADNLGALVYSLSGTDASLLNINASTGAVTLKSSADYETKTSYSFNVIASDGTNTATKAVVVSVTNLNDNAPVFTSGTTGTVAENAATSTVIYTAAATDADNLVALSYSLSGTDASLLNISASTGAVTLKSSANYETKTSYSFNVIASDGTLTSTQPVVVSVTNLNDNAPVFTSGTTGTVAENAALSTVIYTATATDADNLGALSYSLSGTDASLLNLNSSTGAVTLKSSADYETKASYSFTVTASDGANTTSQAVVVSVTNLNDNVPVFTSGGTGSVAENAATSTVIYTAVATDADNLGALAYSLSGTDASLLNINATTGAVTLKSSADYELRTSYSFNVVASDGANTVTRAVVVSVTNVNDNTPVFTSGGSGMVVTQSPAGTLVYTAVATDADNLGALAYSLSGTDASLLNINSTTGAVTLKNTADFATKPSYSFNVVASDGTNTTSKAVLVTVQTVNNYAPVFTSGGTGTVAENAATSTVIYTAVATDADGNTLTYSLSGADASLLNINAMTGAVTLKSSADYETKTSYSFNVVASDGVPAHDVTKAVVVSVTNLNDNAPVFTSGGTGTVAENAATSTVIYTAVATDADNLGALTYSLSGADASLLNINATTGAVTLKSSADYETKTSYSFNVVAGDGTNNTSKAVVVSVTNLNDNAPVFSSGSTGTVINNSPSGTVIYNAVANDADNQGALTYSLSGADASLLNIDATTGAVSLKSPANDTIKPSYNFNVVASDGTFVTNKAVIVTVQTVNNYAPVFTSGGTGSVAENAATSTVIYTAVATDADLNSVTYSLSGADASLLNIDAATGAVTLKTAANYETKTSYSFNVVASDSLPAHDVTRSVVVSVTNLNDNAPVFTSGGTGTVAENATLSTVIYTAVATDADNLGALTYSLSGADASLLNINATTGAVTLKSSADYETKTSYSFNVVASDGTNNTSKAVVVSVTNLNDNSPVFTSGSTGTVAENAATSTVIYTAVATDADNLGALTYSLSGADASLLNIDATSGAVTLKSSADYETKTSYSFNVVAGDGTNNTSKAVVVSVTNLNDNAPVFSSGSTGTVINNSPSGTVIYNAVANDADNQGALTYSLSGADASLLNIDATTGAVSLKSPANDTIKPSYNFNVVASDGTFVTNKAVIVTVQTVNNYAPVFTSGGTGSVAENAATSTVIYTAVATDADLNSVTYSLSGADASLLNIDAATGAVTLKTAANYETKTSYSFNVVASDSLPAHDVTRSVVVSVTNLNDNSPVFTSGGTGTVAENATLSTVIYTAVATDADNLGALTYSLSGADASLLNINATTGAVTLKSSADYETKTSYSFNVVASDGTNNTSKAVVVSVTNLNDNSPVFSSGGTGTVAENAATSMVIYTAVATDADNLGALTYSLSGADASLLNINATTGAVTLKSSADYEVKSSYSFNVVASDGTSNTTRTVLVGVTNVNEPPVSSNDSAATHDTVARLLGIDDFGVYSDPENSPVSSIKIVSLPSSSSGVLQLFNGSSWNSVTNGQVIMSSEIAAGNVRFVPVVGMTSASIGFLVNDGSLYSSSVSPYTLTVYAEQVQTVSPGTVQTIDTTGITVTVPAALTLFSDSLPTNSLDLHDRIAAFADQLVTDTTGHDNVHTAIDTFVSRLSDPSSVNVREFELQADASFNTANPINIDGRVAGHEALVIDASHLPAGTVINLNNVEFAVIIGPAHLGGGSGSNIIVGDRASQYIVLGPGDDVLDGGAGDDTIGSLAGNDTFIGGDGVDTALFNSAFNHYSITYDEAADTYTVVDTIGSDGTDTVTGFEHFQFADVTKSATDPTLLDTTAPTVTSFTPSNGSTGAGVSDTIVLKFSEAVHLGTGLIEIHSGSATGALVESFNAASSTHLTVSGDTLTIDPTNNFANSTDYYVTFADGSIQDYASNHYTAASAYHFSTVAAAVSATGGSSSGGGGGAVIAGAAALGILAWLIL